MLYYSIFKRRHLMKIKALCLFCLCLILSCSIVAAHDTNTTDSEIDALKTSDDTILSDETTVNATKSGIRNITFSDGYNGYCINLSKDHAEVGSVFTPKDTSHAMNNKYNTSIGNYLKILFVDFYDTASTDSDAASEVIWDFSDRYYLNSNNPITQAILKLAEEGRVIPDHGQTKQIDEKTEAIFDFEVFDPLNDDMQNYFGYKITLKEIQNNSSESNNTNIINQTNSNSTNKSADKTNNINKNESNEIQKDIAKNNQKTNDIKSNKNSSAFQSISNTTGNPIILLLLVFSIIGFKRIYKK